MGSSSAAPVTSRGPNIFSSRGLLGSTTVLRLADPLLTCAAQRLPASSGEREVNDAHLIASYSTCTPYSLNDCYLCTGTARDFSVICGWKYIRDRSEGTLT